MSSRVTLDVRDEWRTDEIRDVDLGSDLDVHIDTEITPIAWTGLALLGLGFFLVVLGSLFFVWGYPDAWYALDRSLAASQAFIRRVVILFGLGIVGIFFGSSLYFFGRRTRGRGHVEGIRAGDSA